MDYDFGLKLLVVVGFGIILGAVSMIPVGAVQLHVIKKALQGHLRAAVTTSLGSVTSDLIYGVLVLFGFNKFMMERPWQIALYSAGVLLLSGILVKMILDRNKPQVRETTTPKYQGRLSFVSGFSMAITNPGMLVWWIIGYGTLFNLGIFTDVTLCIKIIFLFSACIGLGGYLIAVGYAVYKLQKSFSDKILRRINIFIFSLLGLLVLYFAFKLVCIIFNIRLDIGGI